MNSIERVWFELLRMTHGVRDEMLGVLTKADLDSRPPGDNPSLGELCAEMGRVERAYAQSFESFRFDLEVPLDPDDPFPGSEGLVNWFHRRDAELEGALRSLSEADVEERKIDRGGWTVPPTQQFHIYREALLLFFGKADVYLRAVNKDRPPQWRQWVG